MEKVLRSREENINVQSSLKTTIEYCQLIGKKDITPKELFRLAFVFSEHCQYVDDAEFKEMLNSATEWLFPKKEVLL